jgi:hypothetical protein
MVLLTACDDDGNHLNGDASQDASMADSSQGSDLAWPQLPPRPAHQTCAPQPVDFDRKPDLVSTTTMENVDPRGAVALRQPSIIGDWWIAYNDGRLVTLRTGPGATSPRLITQWPDPILDMYLDPAFGRIGQVYVSVRSGVGFAVWNLEVEDQVVLSRNEVFHGDGDGLFAADQDGVVHISTTEGLVSITSGESVHPGSSQGRCYFDMDGLTCFGDQALSCETGEGVIFRGSDAPILWGAQIYVCGNSVYARERVSGVWIDREILTHDVPLGGVFLDRLGRLHGHDESGRILRLRLSEPDYALGWPETLSETGCLDQQVRPGPDLIPYRVNAPLWTDGALKRRWMVLPPGSRAQVKEDGDWELPVGSVLVKQFDLPDEAGVVRPVETRFMTRWPFGWSFQTYRWRDDGSDADLLDGTKSVYRRVATPQGSFEYLFPQHQTCRACHRNQSASVLGLSTAQLTAGPVGVGQLDRFLAIDVIEEIPQANVLPNPDDSSISAYRRARATLHAQCAHCHRPQGWAPPDLDLDLRWSTPWANTRLCNVRNQYSSFDVPGEMRINPGNPADSSIVTRQLAPGYGRMPLGSALIDPRATGILEPWIESMVDCAPPD